MRKTAFIFFLLFALLSLFLLGKNWYNLFPIRGMDSVFPKCEESKIKVRLYQHETNQVRVLSLEDYLIGVVAAEMPAAYPMEALKAQATSARTYIFKRLTARKMENQLHPGADICDDHRHGQAWLSKEKMKERWGALPYYHYYHKIKIAVLSTSGEVLTYQGKLIDPVYHASCGGQATENSEDVWKFAIPYLRSVPCLHEPEPPREVSFNISEFKYLLNKKNVVIPVLAGNTQAQFSILERTATGRPKLLKIGNKAIPAVVIRDLLGLRSTNFSWHQEKDKVTFFTTGYGHGVGMCQKGAKAMAERGNTHQDILTYYYQGAKIGYTNK